MPPKHAILAATFREAFTFSGSFTDAAPTFDTIISGGANGEKSVGVNLCVKDYSAIFESFRASGFNAPRCCGGEYDPFFVCIDSDGKFLFTTGKHRLALAKAAGLEKIGVRVSARHIEWVSYRREFLQRIRSGTVSELDHERWGHPDLQDLIRS